MEKKVIAIEEREGPFQEMFQRIMKLVPEKDRDDKNLQRLIAFRLELDGEESTSQYLSTKIREAVERAHPGSLYTFLKDDLHKDNDRNPTPPEVA